MGTQPIDPSTGQFQSRPAAERFWEKVDKTDTCWLWTAALGVGGYGEFRVTATLQGKAHRWAWENLVGPIPEGLTIDHLCKIRRCVNPAHMELVTSAENALRGSGPPAENARKTHCKNGHPLTESTNGRRLCRVCRNEGIRVWSRAKRAAEGKIPGRGGYLAAKTHCPQGHPYDEANTYIRPSGHRICRQCNRDGRRKKS